jgi:hypothetical protein
MACRFTLVAGQHVGKHAIDRMMNKIYYTAYGWTPEDSRRAAR